jgi:hypothetical protein
MMVMMMMMMIMRVEAEENLIESNSTQLKQ